MLDNDTVDAQSLLARFEAVLDKVMNDHEARIRTLERKNHLVNAVISGVVSITVAVVAALAGCSLPETQEPVTPAQVSSAVVYIEGHYTPEDPISQLACEMYGGCGYNGTGWFVDDDTVVTAGHMCDTEGVVLLAEDNSGPEPVFRGLEVVYFDLGSEYGPVPEADICVLQVVDPDSYGAHGALRLAGDSDLAYGTKVWYVGYPGGEPALYYGHVTGHMEDEDGVTVRLQVAFPAWGGASGSPVMDMRGKVVGVIVESYVDNGIVMRVVPVEDVREALEIAED